MGAKNSGCPSMAEIPTIEYFICSIYFKQLSYVNTDRMPTIVVGACGREKRIEEVVNKGCKWDDIETLLTTYRANRLS